MRGSKLRPLDDSDRAFVDGLYEEFKNLIYAVARKYFGGNQADVDEAFSRVLECMCKYVDKFRGADSNKMESYVISTIVNVCRQMLIERRRQSGLDTFEEYDEQMPDPVDPYSSIFEKAAVSELLDSLKGLKEKYKLLLALRYGEDMEPADIAQRLNVTENAVCSALTRAKKSALKAILAKRGEEENDDDGKE